MRGEAPEISAARKLTLETRRRLQMSPAFQRLDPAARAELMGNLDRVTQVFCEGAAPPSQAPADPYAFALDTPDDFYRRRREAGFVESPSPDSPDAETQPTEQKKAFKAEATAGLGQNVGGLMDEVDFPSFVAGILNSAFDAMVDASIRQMEAYADLISAVANDIEGFTQTHVTSNQARDWLAEKYPADLALDLTNGARIEPRTKESEFGESPSPAWLEDFGLAGQPLTDTLVEEQLVPMARRRIGESRLKTLATMVLLGMNRIVVRDGSIKARVLFRAAAKDKTKLDYAVSQDPGGASWASRGGQAYEMHSTKVSTVGINAQSTASLTADLFGEVVINFASETLPLEQMVDQARLALVQKNSRNPNAAVGGSPGASVEEGTPAADQPVAAAPEPAVTSEGGEPT